MLLMAPRRNSNNSSSSIVHQQQYQHTPQQQQQQQTLLLASAFYSGDFDTNSNNSNNNMSPMQTSNSTAVNAVANHNHHSSNGNGNSNCNNVNNNHGNGNEQFTRCCYPQGDCFKVDSIIALDDLSECVRVICNNENCNVGQYMHRECFEAWEQTVLVSLKSLGRARSWSDRQRTQNLWTKKGYDLVYKACGCKCGRGHMRKDLEWSPPALKNGSANGHFGVSSAVQRIVNGSGGGGNNACNEAEEDKKRKKKRNRNNQKPALALTPHNPNGYHPNSQQQQQQQQIHINGNSAAIPNGSNNVHVGNNTATVNNGSNNHAVNNSHNNTNVGNNLSPNPNVGVIGSGLPHNSNQQQQQQQQMQAPMLLQQQQQQQQSVVASFNTLISGNSNILGLDLRARTGSLSSGDGSGSTSPSASQSSGEISISPIHQQHQLQQQQPHLQQQQQQQQFQHLQQYQQNLLQNGLSKSILGGINGMNGCMSVVKQPPSSVAAIMGNGLQHLNAFDQQQFVQQQKNKEVELYSEKVRSTSGCNGIFSRRLDFSSFNLLPKTRLNSYQVKIEDEGNHGNDETRLFILSSLAQSQMSRVACILCEEPMLVFDRYPLVDGSFFLSPKQHSPGCIEVKYEGRALYLTCVCMGCLDGSTTNRIISCRFCNELWDGSNLVLGTMYAYDIFAAMPCCAERLKCNHCCKLLLHPQQRLNFYSDYSHCVTCPYCTTQDTHFVKPLSYCYAKSTAQRQQQIA